MRSERGQGSVEWVGLLAVVALLMAGLIGAGVRLPGTALAHALASRLLCAASLANSCEDDEPALIAAYGSELGELARRHMPWILLERGSRALPVDFRRCRRSACADGSPRGLVRRSDRGLPVTAFVHVVDCRAAAGTAAAEPPGSGGAAALPAGPDCSGRAAGNLYIQYWLYYADSATLRGVPVIGAAGYHRDDWESVQVRIRPGGRVEERASSHHGYNHRGGFVNWGSDAGIAPLEEVAEAVGARSRGGWWPETRLLFVAGGSHAGSTAGALHFDRVVRGRRVHLVPLEPILGALDGYRFAIAPPWRKQVWRHPEATGTN